MNTQNDMQNREQRSTPSSDNAGDNAAVVSTTRARAGATGHNVRYVLAVGLAAVIIAFAVIYLSYFV